MRILFSVFFIYFIFFCDKENLFFIKLKLFFYFNKYYIFGIYQNKNKLIFKYLLEKKKNNKKYKNYGIIVGFLNNLVVKVDFFFGDSNFVLL